MAKYDGLIIPRSYNDYINKSDPVGVQQALALTGVMDDTPTAGSSKPVKSSGLVGLSAVDVVETGNMHPVTSNAAATLAPVNEVTSGNMHSVTSNAVANAMSYSTSEVNTGKKWIDGKPIYRKVVDFGALPNNAEKTVAHNLTNIDNFVLITAIAYDTSGNYLPIPYADTYQIGYSIRLMLNKTNVIIQTGYDRSTYTKTYVTLEYTKTTD